MRELGVMQRVLGTLHASSWAITDGPTTAEGGLLGAARCLGVLMRWSADVLRFLCRMKQSMRGTPNHMRHASCQQRGHWLGTGGGPALQHVQGQWENLEQCHGELSPSTGRVIYLFQRSWWKNMLLSSMLKPNQ